MRHSSSFGSVEPLEARIAPATLSPVATAHWLTGQPGDVFELHAGDGLSTAGDKAGAYLLYVEKGNVRVFTTDLNNNGTLDENEITGIAAGDGLRITLFADVHGDIATNLREVTSSFGLVLTLSDSNNNAIDDDPAQKGDGLVILNNTIEKIELRTLIPADLPDQNNDGLIDDRDVLLRAAPTSFSIFGNIYAGKGFGLASDPTSGLIIDSSGAATYSVLLGATEVHPTIGSVKVGTAVSGQWLSYGVSRNDDIAGTIARFIPLPGQHGADIAFVRSANQGTVFNFNSLIAGDGGVGASGGDVVGVTLNADDSGGYQILAGNGGRGPTGGHGGSIVNFTDLGSHTGKVLIRSGSGGVGTTNAGGTAGDFTFKTVNIYGFVSFELGDGGSGFAAGGDGASLLTGNFTQTATPYNAGATFGTYHQSTFDGNDNPLNIGTHRAIDFDGDGYGDFVYTTIDTSQLVVVFGADAVDPNAAPGARSLRPERIYLSGVRNAEALTVADLNGDGHLDIAVASIDASNRSGIAVFLAKFEDLNNDGVLSSSEDLNGNGVNDFIGFYDGRWSTLPQLTGFDTNPKVDTKPYTGGGGIFPVGKDRLYRTSPIAIGDIAAGDFDGDGKQELAVSANYSGVEVILFLTQDIEDNDLTGVPFLTGQFYADYGAKEIKTPTGNTNPDPRKPYISGFDGAPGHHLIEATALTNTDGHDVLFVASRDLNSDTSTGSGTYSSSARVLDYQARQSTVAGGKFVAHSPIVAGFYSFGTVDTNRDVGNISPASAIPIDFTIVDYDEDGNADAIAITGETAGFGFMVGSQGDGTGFGSPVSGLGDNAGDFFGIPGYGTDPHDMAQIRSIDGDGNGTVHDVVLFGTLASATQGRVMKFVEGGAESSIILAAIGDNFASINPQGPNLADVYYPDAANLGAPVAYAAQGTSALAFFDVLALHTPAKFAVSNNQAGYLIHAGDGGNSIVGNGGLGGGLGIGSKLTTFTTIDPITGVSTSLKDLVGSVQFQINGTIDLLAGKGGDGFAKGGKGGGIIGVVSRGDANVTLTAGDGGRGVSGAGGSGGSLAADSIIGGLRWIAGKGGSGSTGGGGGSIIGNGSNIGVGAFIADTVLPGGTVATLTVLAGDGGSGTRGGGAGGSINSFLTDINGSFFRMEAGDGGPSVSGTGGAGGNIANSSPKIGSILTSDVALIAGNGGGGVTGGRGGSVTNFLFAPPSTDDNVRPALFSAIGGHGGGGTAGNGGAGGSVSSVNVPTKGATNAPVLQNYNFNRILGGNGGASAGGNGGIGGSVLNIKTSAGDAAYALIGGAGGDGLRAGGAGGSVNTAQVELGSSTSSKLLVIAGAGGDASAFLPNLEKDSAGAFRDTTPDQDKKSFGGVVGRGGQGGNIVGFTQIGNLNAHVDLIAGNGGDTIHYGTVLDKVTFAGRGGDIIHTFVRGDIGNLDNGNTSPNVAIKSYNNDLAGESVATFVETKIRNNPLAVKGPKHPPISLSDADGNVGIVVGSAGRIKVIYNPGTGLFETQRATFPNKDGNGDLIDLTANNLLSAIAGSVNSIAVIHAARGIKILNGVIGGDKPTLGQFDYQDQNGNAITKPVRNGRLVDGAIIASAITDLAGNPVDLIGRDFLL